MISYSMQSGTRISADRIYTLDAAMYMQ